MREPPLERIGDGKIPIAAWKRLDQQIVSARQDRARALLLQPVAHLFGQMLPACRARQHRAHAFGEIGRERKLAAHVGGNFRRIALRAPNQRLVLGNALQGQYLAAEQERVAGRQRLDEIFLDLAEHAAVTGERAGVVARPHCDVIASGAKQSIPGSSLSRSGDGLRRFRRSRLPPTSVGLAMTDWRPTFRASRTFSFVSSTITPTFMR